MLHFLKINITWCGLQQYFPAVFCYWEGRQEYRDGNEDANGWVGIVSSWNVRLPDNKSRDDDTNVVDGITDDMNEDPK